MKITEDDFSKLRGRFIIQLNKGQEPNLKENSDFWIEKRIRFVVDTREGIYLSGVYYSTGPYTMDQFVNHFNEPTEGRYHRLLTDSELDWLFGEFKKINY